MLKITTRRTASGYELKPLKLEDMERIRIARNAQIDVLRQKREISQEEQMAYFKNVVQVEQNKDKPHLILFSLFKEATWIGYGGLVHIDWEHLRGEVSFLLETERAKNDELYAQDFANYLELLFPIAFEDLGLKRLHTETFSSRVFQIGLLEKHGFRYEGRLKDHVIINGVPHDSILHGILKNNIQF